MNIYEKINNVKAGILEANLKKSGKNSFAKYDYYELSDILPTIVKLCKENKLFTQILFTDETAVLNIINAEKSDEVLVYTSPTTELELKGCNKIQAMGGVQTYMRRYLYMNAFDIVENDMFDGQEQKEEVKKKEFGEENWEKFTKVFNTYKDENEAIKTVEDNYTLSEEYRKMIKELYNLAKE